MVAIRTPASQRIVVNWNVQAFANECSEATGARNFGTYIGHSPSAERATDVFSTIPMPRSNRVLGDAVAEFTLRPDVWRRFAVRYIIWRQRINWNDGEGWRAMANRGDDTQNHFDHDHISFNVIPAPASRPTPAAPNQGGIDVLIVNVQDTGIFMLRGGATQHMTHPDHVLAWVRAGVPYQDKVALTPELFQQYGGWIPPRGLMGTDPADDATPYDEMIAAVQSGLDAIHDEYVRSLQLD